jgi:PAS domain S-box-containing protein
MIEWMSSIVGNALNEETFLYFGLCLLMSIPVFYLVRFLFNKRSGYRSKEFEVLRERYDYLLNGYHDPVLIFDQDSEKILQWNQSLVRRIGYGKKELQQTPVRSILVAGESSESREDLNRLMKGESVDTDLLYVQNQDGNVIRVSASSSLIPVESSDSRVIQVVMRDLSLRNALQDKLSRREKMLAVFGIITRLLNTGEDTPGRFKGLIRIVGEVMESDITSILFIGQDDEMASGYQFDSNLVDEIQNVIVEIPDDSIYRWVSDNKQPLLREELNGVADYSEERELYRKGIRSYLIFPLILRDRVVGTLNIFNKSPGNVQEDDVDILGHIASHLTLGINNIQLQREAEKKAQRLKQILVTSNSFRLQVFLDDLLREIVWSIRFSTGFNFVLLSMLNSETKRVEIKALADNEKGIMKRLIGTTYSWESFRNLMREEKKVSHSYLVEREESVLVKIKELIWGSNEPADRKDGKRKGHALFVPIETRLGKIVGFLLVDDPQETDGQSIETIQTMEIFANEVAVVIDNQRLFEEAKKKSEELEIVNKELQVSKENLENAKKMLETYNKELEKANAELREVDKLKAEFLQNVTHELRTPLAPIMVNSEVLLLKKIGDLTPVQEEIVQSIFQSTKRLNLLIDDLLDLTKMESGKMKYQFTLVNPESLANNSLVEAYPFGQEKNITIEKHLDCGDMQIYGDSSRLIQLMTNLLRNAIKFTPEGGRIDLSMNRKNGDRIELKVVDTGVGIPASKLDKIFDRFYQVDGSATRKYKGAGLGLSIVKKIVEAHQGEIDVMSEEGRGTAVTVLLPARQGKVGEENLVSQSSS